MVWFFSKSNPLLFSLSFAKWLVYCLSVFALVSSTPGNNRARNVKAPHRAGSATGHPHKFTGTPKVLAQVLSSSSYPEPRAAEPGAHAWTAAQAPQPPARLQGCSAQTAGNLRNPHRGELSPPAPSRAADNEVAFPASRSSRPRLPHRANATSARVRAPTAQARDRPGAERRRRACETRTAGTRARPRPRPSPRCPAPEPPSPRTSPGSRVTFQVRSWSPRAAAPASRRPLPRRPPQQPPAPDPRAGRLSPPGPCAERAARARGCGHRR